MEYYELCLENSRWVIDPRLKLTAAFYKPKAFWINFTVDRFLLKSDRIPDRAPNSYHTFHHINPYSRRRQSGSQGIHDRSQEKYRFWWVTPRRHYFDADSYNFKWTVLRRIERLDMIHHEDLRLPAFPVLFSRAPISEFSFMIEKLLVLKVTVVFWLNSSGLLWN